MSEKESQRIMREFRKAYDGQRQPEYPEGTVVCKGVWTKDGLRIRDLREEDVLTGSDHEGDL